MNPYAHLKDEMLSQYLMTACLHLIIFIGLTDHP